MIRLAAGSPVLEVAPQREIRARKSDVGPGDVCGGDQRHLQALCPGGVTRRRQRRAEEHVHLLGVQHVIILSDNDAVGRKQAELVAAALHAYHVDVRVVALPGLGLSQDVYDWFAVGHTREELEAIISVAAEEDIYVLSDEIYEKLVYDEAKHASVASLSKEAYDLTITINGFSKSYAMTGWRLGYLAAPDAVARAVDSIQSHTSSNPSSFSQYGALAALKGDQQPLSDMREEFDMRRNYMFDRLSKISNVTAVKPQGAFYILVNISQLGLTSQNFADRLLSKANVAVVPGAAFGDDRTVRFSYATSLDVIKKGLDRFQDFCRTL